MKDTSSITAHRLHASDVRHGEARRLGDAPATVDEREIDYRLGFDLGYRDGLAGATRDAEARADEARQAWTAQAQRQLDDERAVLRAEGDALVAVASAWRARLEEEDAWNAAIVVEAVHAVVLSYLGHRGMNAALVAELCAQTLRGMQERPLVLRVSAMDIDTVSREVGTLADVQADERLASGECEIDSPRGRLVTGVAERMDILRDELLRRLAVGAAQGRAP